MPSPRASVAIRPSVSLPHRLLVASLIAAFGLMTGPAEELGAQGLPPVNIQHFRPAPGPADYLNLYGSGLTSHLDYHAGFYLNYADAPLEANSIDARSREVVDFQVAGDLIASFGVSGVMEVGLALPVTLLQSSDDLRPISLDSDNASLGTFALGDPRISTKFEFSSILTGYGLGAVAVFYVPVGDDQALTGDGSVGAELRGIADFMLPYGIRVGTNLGLRYRAKGRRIRPEGGAFVGNEILWGGAAVIPLWEENLDTIFELVGEIPIPTSGDEMVEESVPVELLGGFRYSLTDTWTLTAAAGTKVTNGYGAPQSRVLIGLGQQWVAGGKWNWDYDGDGFVGDDDRCPREPEDRDGYRDEDGCPDPDNDGDGVPDKRDKCADAGGEFVTADGCPDNDIDGDNIPDDQDKCPEDPEDYDSFQDSDGCPDLDNDDDGIIDSKDSCPDSPETFNGIVDDDGCPEREGQKVIVTKNRIEILEKVYFNTGKDSIRKESFDVLDAVAEALNANLDINLVRIEGHTDSVGSSGYNLKLSQRRAESVRKYLTDRDVGEGRLKAVGYGEDKPIDDNNTREGRSRNRRVEFIIVERGKQSQPDWTAPDGDDSDDPFGGGDGFP